MSHLILENISKTFRGTEVLTDVKLQVGIGEFICLLGPSGSGKSTILRLIGGFEQPDVGYILLDGEQIQDQPPNKRNIGFVFQDYALFPHMTVEENIAFGLKCKKIDKQQMQERIRFVLNLVGLTGLEKRYAKQLSGGQQQRVTIARVVALHPSVLLLDEPLSNLDAKLRRQIRLELRALQKKLGTTTIMVTHDQEEAMTMGDRIAVLQNGVIQQFGTPLELYNHPVNLFVAGFLGDPPINLLECKGEVRQEKTGVSVSNVFFNVELSAGSRIGEWKEKSCILGIRPEDIEIKSPGEGSLDAVVEIVEHMGSSALIYTRTASGNQICALSPTKRIPEPGQTLGLLFQYEKCLLFDAETTKTMKDVVMTAALTAEATV
ncbi:ABC transporter ATP-binding protein [Paenibacillus piri]|uniref:ABC transporter ATP-binding protein n=1 Tax=Paenibacillus piri TaxID=2547395 RepID=A0A4R5KK34_9BACL|nr:ABC transporter ATP-binding protein [Paenibacillus piri]TDF95929.1 ABC transporter ATP-binding protein [Paenibacillus piri]